MMKKLYYQLLMYPILMIIISSLFLGIYFIVQHNIHFEKLKMDLVNQNITLRDQQTEEKVKDALVRMKMHHNMVETELKKRIKNKVNDLLYGLDHLYEKYHKNLDKTKMQKLLIDYIESVKFSDPDGFFFVNDLNNNTILSHKKMPHLVKTDMTNYKDSQGINLTLSKKNILKKQKSGFQKVYFPKPSNINKQYPKIVYFTKFEQYNWLIGTGEYTDTIVKEMENLFLKKITFLEKQLESDLFMWKVHENLSSSNFTIIFSKDLKNHIGKKTPKDLVKKVLTPEVINNLQKNNASKATYTINKFNQAQPKEKHSYLYYYKPWNIILGSGVFDEDLNKLIKKKEKLIEKKQTQDILNIIIITTLIICFTIVVSYYLLRKLVKILQNNEKQIDRLNKELQKKVNTQFDQLRQQDMLLVQKSKNEELGELMVVITHQWRQPLNIINSTTAKLYKDTITNKINQNKMMRYISEIEDITAYMSSTIDDFNKFYSRSLKMEVFDPLESIEKVIGFVFSKYSLNLKLNLKSNINIDQRKKITLFGLESNFQQVVIIILNNAIDQFKQKNIQNPMIDIVIDKKGKTAIIEFRDNGGGIQSAILDTIFDIYVTTKKENYNGIGLYMCKLILKTHFQGNIYASNSSSGAIFTMEFNDDEKV